VVPVGPIQRAGARLSPQPPSFQPAILASEKSLSVTAERLFVLIGGSQSSTFTVKEGMAIGHAIEELELFATASEDGEWDGQVLFVTGRPAP